MAHHHLPQLYIGLLTFLSPGEQKNSAGKDHQSHPREWLPWELSSANSESQHQVELSKVNDSLLRQPRFQNQICSRSAQGVFTGLKRMLSPYV